MNKNTCLRVIGNRKIDGVIKISGSKNEALPIISSTLLKKDIYHFYNVPNILDVNKLLEILEYLNVKIERKKELVIIDTREVIIKPLTITQISQIRASYYVLFALLNKNTSIEYSFPGGCNFTSRPIDYHLNLIKSFGGDYHFNNNCIKVDISEIKACEYTLEKKSFGATINAIFLGVKCKKESKLYNYSNEPEVMHVISYLKQCGYSINIHENYLSFNEKNDIYPIDYSINSDRIEAETFYLLSKALGNIVLIGFNSLEHKAMTSLFKKDIFIDKDIVYSFKESIDELEIYSFDNYPNLSTDIGPILISFLILNKKEFWASDKIYPSRITALKEYSKMIKEEKDDAYYFCSFEIDNRIFYGTNLRDTMAYLFYALTHNGVFYIYGIEHLQRGYEDLIDKLISLNCKIDILENNDEKED
ncbi:MAG: hypothetical protein PUA56_06235 [Bacillales bacterium]|nr:hypothetical protein [Bacillales bacterium]